MPEVLLASPDDWERVRSLRLRALRDAPDAFWAGLDEEAGLSPDEWRARLSADDYGVFVALLDGEDVGLVGVGHSHHHQTDCAVSMTWVAPEVRSRGVGDALVEAAIAWARSRGFPRVRLWVSDTNPAAERLYERHGFAPTGVTGTYRAPREHITEHERALEL